MSPTPPHPEDATVLMVAAAGGDKTFIDDTLPVGSTGVVYELTGIRSTRRGLSNQFNVNFGVGGGGGFTVTQVTLFYCKGCGRYLGNKWVCAWSWRCIVCGLRC